MSYLLFSHNKGYDVSGCEAVCFPIISPFASRHGDLASHGPVDYQCGHRALSVIQYFPFFGMIASLIERIIACIYQWQQDQGQPANPNKELLQSHKLTPYASPLGNYTAPIPATALKLEATERALAAIPPLSLAAPSALDSPTPKTPVRDAAPSSPESPSPQAAANGSPNGAAAASPLTAPPERPKTPERDSSAASTSPITPMKTPERDNASAFHTPPSAIRPAGCAPATPQSPAASIPNIDALLTSKVVPVPAAHASLTVEQQKALLESTRLAFAEHLEREQEVGSVDHLATVAEANLPQTFETWFKSSVPLTFETHSCSEKGTRTTQEDALFHYEDADTVLGGIFDGHKRSKFVKGEDAANHASDNFVSTFFDKMKTAKHVTDAMQQTIYSVQETAPTDVAQNAGATAIVYHIDKKTNIAILGIAGDCIGSLYRKIKETRKCFPISRIHDWRSPREIARVGKDNIVFDRNHLGHETNPKFWRLQGTWGPNFSRSVMDLSWGKDISHELEFTAIQLEPDDLLVFGCDGLPDFVKSPAILQTVNAHETGDLARTLTDQSLKNQRYTPDKDNVTVITLRCKAAPSSSSN